MLIYPLETHLSYAGEYKENKGMQTICYFMKSVQSVKNTPEKAGFPLEKIFVFIISAGYEVTSSNIELLSKVLNVLYYILLIYLAF